MERIAVIGTSGSGQTTRARRLGERLDLPHLELDSIHHQAGWQSLDDEEFRRRVGEFCAGDRWVTCGKYSIVRDILFERADTVVCLDHNRVRQTARVWARSARRAATREELWNGNREGWRGVWPFGDADKTLVPWTWRAIPRARRLFDNVAGDERYGHLTVVRLRGWREIDGFLDAAPT